MAAGKYDITIEQGSTFELSITYKNPSGIAFDMLSTVNGYTVRTKIKDSSDGSDILSVTAVYNTADTPASNFNSNTSVIQLDGTGIGQNTNKSPNIRLVIPPVVTDSFSFERGVYDIEVENSSGSVERILEGRVKLSKAITR